MDVPGILLSCPQRLSLRERRVPARHVLCHSVAPSRALEASPALRPVCVRSRLLARSPASLRVLLPASIAGNTHSRVMISKEVHGPRRYCCSFRSAGFADGPRGTDQDFNTPATASRTSSCSRRAACFWMTKSGPSSGRLRPAADSGVAEKSRLRRQAASARPIDSSAGCHAYACAGMWGIGATWLHKRGHGTRLRLSLRGAQRRSHLLPASCETWVVSR
jgi:hypothetical protein